MVDTKLKGLAMYLKLCLSFIPSFSGYVIRLTPLIHRFKNSEKDFTVDYQRCFALTACLHIFLFSSLQDSYMNEDFQLKSQADQVLSQDSTYQGDRGGYQAYSQPEFSQNIYNSQF